MPIVQQTTLFDEPRCIAILWDERCPCHGEVVGLFSDGSRVCGVTFTTVEEADDGKQADGEGASQA